jgi:hypothetical protein
VRSFLIVFIFITSLLAANAAEVTCSCSDDFFSEYLKTNHSHSENGQNATNDHCDHTCVQCHFSAVIPPSYNFISTSYSVSSEFVDIQKQPLKISLSLYRPPIA